MKGAVFQEFGGPLQVCELAVPKVDPWGALIHVAACGICRSDWHAWKGHDSEVQLPHVPGHELAGEVAAVGERVRNWRVGDRVTVPFCCGCGTCIECATGNSQICDRYSQPGFTHWGAFAEYVEIRHADVNLVRLPEQIEYTTAASLGCRFVTSFRAVVHQGRVTAGEWLAVHGCGGVGLSAIMIGRAMGAQVIGIDPQPERLALAARLGAVELIDPNRHDVVTRIRQITGRGAQVSMDALGHRQTCWNSIECLAKRGRHVQVGLMLGSEAEPQVPMGAVIAKELEIYGSHGMQPVEYAKIFSMMQHGLLQPEQLVKDLVTLEAGAKLLTEMDHFPGTGITVISLASV